MELEIGPLMIKFRTHLKLSPKEWHRKTDQSNKKNKLMFKTKKVMEQLGPVKQNLRQLEKRIK
tara:strand:+ start:1091 stop:1279 length:189 start_codon:yes stop_codon:yes gene_type:complete